MISPAPPLLALAAFVGVPACAALFLSAAAQPASIVVLAALVALAVFDALAGSRRMTKIRVLAPPALKWFKNRRSAFPLTLENARTQEVKVAPELPLSFSLSEPIADWDPTQSSIEFQCVPTLRGNFDITRCSLSGISPSKLWLLRSEREIHTDIQVFPDLEHEPGAKLLLLRKSGGLRNQRLIGRGREFERLRDYAAGDSFEEVAWKATARRGKPVVRVFQVERTQDVYVVIDSSRLSSRDAAVDRYVNAALMVALATESYGDNFGLVTFSDRVDHFVRANRGLTHFSRCREAIFDLATRPVSPDFPELFSFLQLNIRRRSLLLFLTDLSDPMLTEAFTRDVHIVSSRHKVVVNSLRDEQTRPVFTGALPETVEEVNLRLAGHLEWANLQDLQKKLQRYGVGTALLSPEKTGIDLVQQYSSVKRMQAL